MHVILSNGRYNIIVFKLELHIRNLYPKVVLLDWMLDKFILT